MYQLRELEKKDLIEINKWRNDPELISCLGAPFRYINLDVDEKWYENYMASRGSTVRCAITSEADKNEKIIGLVSLTDIDYLNQSAQFHIMIGNNANRGKGIGTFAVKAILYHAFFNLNLRRIYLSALETNENARHLYEKCGFKKEGALRKATFKNGQFVDLVLYSILKDEYELNK